MANIQHYLFANNLHRSGPTREAIEHLMDRFGIGWNEAIRELNAALSANDGT